LKCGKEISDKAISCPNCGCPISQIETDNVLNVQTKYDYKSDENHDIKHELEDIESNFEENISKKRINFKLIICLVFLLSVIITIFLIVNRNKKIVTPFDDLKPNIKKSEVWDAFGSPDYVGDDNDVYCYDNIRFMGLDGELWIRFSGDNMMTYAYWRYEIGKDETFTDYEDEIEKIIVYYTSLYGEAVESKYYDYLWETTVGNEYTLNLEKSSSSFFNDEIEVQYDPR